MTVKNFLTVIAATGLLAGAVMSLVDASKGHGLETNESLHEFVLAQLGGDSPQDLTGDPGTGGGGGTGTPQEEKQYYKKASRLEYVHESSIFNSGSQRNINIKGKDYPIKPNTEYFLEVEGYYCTEFAIAWEYCDTRKAVLNVNLIEGTGTELPPTPPAP